MVKYDEPNRVNDLHLIVDITFCNSFGSLPSSSTSDTEECDRIQISSEPRDRSDTCHSATSSTWTRPSLVLQPSTDSADTATTSDTNMGGGRRVSRII